MQPTSTKSSLHVPRESVHSLSLDRFVQLYQTPGNPVVVTDLLHQQDWNLDYLRQQLGTQPFVLRYYGNERYQQDKRQWKSIGSGVPPKTKPFADYVSLLQSREAHRQDIYLAKCPIHNTPLIHTEAIQSLQNYLNQLGLTRPASTLNLWVGPGGHIEALHYDPTDGTLVQLHGSKRVILFPPSQTANLYPFPFYIHLKHGMKLRSWFSQVYPDRPDFAAFPKLQEALKHKYEVILHPGELLYIPTGWWHEVESLGDGMVCSVNRFWRVYPTRRAVLSWQRWRTHLGSACALPSVAASLVKAAFSPDRSQRFKEILQMF
ncbi:transcription factor jumonji jmjC domain-containing protein [filamentous cyanobacterium CCP2]|nr:transcription factor jumonji jmjC domain-containing protein [filamentous cyanobacterium CCP2]